MTHSFWDSWLPVSDAPEVPRLTPPVLPGLLRVEDDLDPVLPSVEAPTIPGIICPEGKEHLPCTDQEHPSANH